MTWTIRRRQVAGETLAIDIVEGDELVCGVTIRGDIAKAEKRAALIAAVPHLFTALTRALEFGDLDDPTSETYAKAQEAIARVKGQS